MRKTNATLAISEKERIRQRIDVVELFAQMAEGRELPVRSATGDVIDFERPQMGDRVRAMTELLSRVAPKLSNVDITSGDEGGVVFKLAMPDGFALPNSEPKTVADSGASQAILDAVANEVDDTDE